MNRRIGEIYTYVWSWVGLDLAHEIAHSSFLPSSSPPVLCSSVSPDQKKACLPLGAVMVYLCSKSSSWALDDAVRLPTCSALPKYDLPSDRILSGKDRLLPSIQGIISRWKKVSPLIILWLGWVDPQKCGCGGFSDSMGTKRGRDSPPRVFICRCTKVAYNGLQRDMGKVGRPQLKIRGKLWPSIGRGRLLLKTLEDEVGTVGEERAHHGYWVKWALTSG